MKYINHMTAAHLDSKMQALLDQHGAEGYGVYWLIAEHIASQIRPESTNTEWTLSWSALARHLCYTRTTLVQRLISSLATEGLIVLTKRSDKLITISMPNLLKYADEYNKKVLRRKSGQTPDSVGITPKTQALPALLTNKDLGESTSDEPVARPSSIPKKDKCATPNCHHTGTRGRGGKWYCRKCDAELEEVGNQALAIITTRPQ